MTKDSQREISLDAALAAVSFKLDGNFGKKEKKKKCRAFMKKYFFALSHSSKLKSYSKCIKRNVSRQMCVCFLKTCFQPMFLMCLYFCTLTCQSLEEKQTLHRVAV